MKLKVNGENVDVTLDNEKTVGDFLKSFEEAMDVEEATTTGIVLNGKEIAAEEIDTILSQPLTDDTDIELDVVSKAQILESFKSSVASLDKLNGQLGEVSVLLQSGKDVEACTIINTLAEEVDSFVRTARLSSLFPEVFEKITMEGKKLNEFFGEFSDVLRDFEQALADKDTVTVGDLAEYEISPRIQQIIDALNQCC